MIYIDNKDIIEIVKNLNLFDNLNLSAIMNDIIFHKPNHNGAAKVYE